MNLRTIARLIWPASPAKRLKETMRPDPQYRARKLAQMTTERRERYWHNVGGP